EEVVIHYPDGFKVPGYRLRVLKALYGLSISPKLWYNHLINTLKKMRLVPVPESGCVFCNEKLIVCFHVDDIAAFYHARNRDSFEESKRALFEAYTVRDMGEFKWFLATDYQTHDYQRRIGSLTYAAVVSRPDIAKETQKLAEAQLNPSCEHFAATNRVINYLYATLYLAVEYGINKMKPVFIAASDASFGDDVLERVSFKGGLFKLFGGVIDNFSKKK
ncbi:hypothetical protein GcM3_132022, partial [Golovinomyces cichoracearum]